MKETMCNQTDTTKASSSKISLMDNEKFSELISQVGRLSSEQLIRLEQELHLRRTQPQTILTEDELDALQALFREQD
ncbi:hypothetical protein [Vibrio sp. WXL103]|uniref:hypothetical protein n=1 Tax=Vibrio sp. WXL103 TaxID=3450710 RepID=UPI003EC53B8C